jgi:hypothetical protein
MIGTAPSSSNSSPEPPASSSLDTTTSDEDMSSSMHPCQWAGCDTSVISLNQLIEHIREIHVGSGKVSFFFVCQAPNSIYASAQLIIAFLLLSLGCLLL